MILNRMLTVGGLRAAVFDGVDNYLSRGADLSGIADGKQLTCSAWIYRLSATPPAHYIASQRASGAYQGITIDIPTPNYAFRARGANASNTEVEQFVTSAAAPLGEWVNFMFSFDLSSASKIHSYVAGVDQSEAFAVRSDENIDFTRGRFNIGGLPDDPGARLKARMAELWLHPTYIDLSVAANRLKFRSAAGKPAPMGANGSLVTGSAPLLYLRDYLDFKNGRNRGTGGDFTVNGTIMDAKGPW